TMFSRDWSSDVCSSALLDLALDLDRRDARLHTHGVRYAFQAPDATYGRLRALFLVVPFNVAFEGDPAVINDDLYVLRRIGQLALNLVNCVTSDFRVGPLVDYRQADFNVVRPALYSGDPLCIRLGLYLLAVAPHEARKRNDAILDGDINVGGVDIRVPT